MNRKVMVDVGTDVLQEWEEGRLLTILQHQSGTYSYPAAVVELEDGSVVSTYTDRIKFIHPFTEE